MEDKTKKIVSIETVEDTKEPSTGKDELNLAEFPIALLTEKAPKGVKTLEFKDQIFDSGKRKLLNRKLTIEGSETYGLPTAKDDEVILGLIQLSKQKRFHNKTLHFTRFELITLLGWPNTGQSYARVVLALRRWVSVTLHYENAWWDKSEERWTSGAFHIIDDFELNDSRETSSQMTLLTSRINWSNRVFGSFVEGHLKNIRYDIYVKLRSAISKRMFRFLDKRFHHAKTCTFDLRDFAHEHIGLSRSYRDCGKLKEKLNVGVKELEEIGFLEEMSPDERYQHEGRGRWKVTFKRSSPKASIVLPPPSDAKEKQSDLGPPTLATELIARGVSEKTAAELAEQHPAETVQNQIDVFDWLVEKQDKRLAKSPAGYLVKSICDGYKIPKGYVSKAERARVAEAARIRHQAEADERRQKQEVETEERRKKERDVAYWESMPPDKQAELQAKVDAQADPAELAKQTGPFKKFGQLARRTEYIRKLLDAQEAQALTP